MVKNRSAKIQKERQSKRIAFPFFIGSVETVCTPSLHHPMVIYRMTVTRLTVTPPSVYTRTMYMPALNWLMFKV